MGTWILAPDGTNTCCSCQPTVCAPCACPTPVISSGASASGSLCLSGTVYTITATNSPTSYGATGLPSGLSVNTSTGVISGRVRATFSGSITVSATNACGTGTKSVTLTISGSVPTPTLVCDSISASMSKAGFAATDGSAGFYLTSTWSGYVIQYIRSPGDGACTSITSGATGSDEYDYSGYSTYDPSTNTYSGTRQALRYQNGSLIATIPAVNGDDICQHDYTVATCGSPFDKCSCTTSSGMYRGVLGDGVCYGPGPDHLTISAGALETLSAFYTTALLKSNTVASLPAYPGTWAGTCSALTDLSGDEITYTIRRFKYKFTLPTLTGYDCYKITWNEGSTPMSYLWNGTDTETPVYGEVVEPFSNGTIDINSIAVSCACS
jgi:hypothetical protein